MHGPINVKFPNNISKWQMGFNSAFKGLMWKSGWPSLTTVLQSTVKWNLKASKFCQQYCVLANKLYIYMYKVKVIHMWNMFY